MTDINAIREDIEMAARSPAVAQKWAEWFAAERDWEREEAAVTLTHTLRDWQADRDALDRVRALADEWGRCTCDPGPEGQHREDCLTYPADAIRHALNGEGQS